jgi:hypothetical protein
MLATLGRVWDGVGIMEGGNAGRLVGMGAAGEHGGWGGAGVIPSFTNLFWDGCGAVFCTFSSSLSGALACPFVYSLCWGGWLALVCNE